MRSSVLTVLFFGYSFCMAAGALIVSPIGGQRAVRWFLRRWGLGMQRVTKLLLNARIEIRGLDRLPKDGPPAIIASKHQSELDTFILPAMFPQMSAIAMEELANYPLVGPVLRQLDYILVSVEGKRSNQLRQVVDGAARAHAQGRPILIFPEGELMRVGSRQRYRSGVYHIYAALEQPVHPVALSCGLVWPQRRWRKVANQSCVLEFLEPIPPGLDEAAFMAELERRIEEGTMALIREHGDPETVRVAEERYRLGLTNDDAVTAQSLARKRGAELRAAREEEAGEAAGGDTPPNARGGGAHA